MNILGLLNKKKWHASLPVLTLKTCYKSDTYDLDILHRLHQHRDKYIKRMSNWNKEEISERLKEYETETSLLKADDETILTMIFEEKISQLKEAKQRLEKIN